MAVTLENLTRSVVCNAFVDLLDLGAGAGTIQFRTAADSAVAFLTFTDPAFGDASATGTATAAAITSDTNCVGGTITKAMFMTSSASALFTCAVGTATSDINLSSTVINAGDTLSISSLSVSMLAS